MASKKQRDDWDAQQKAHIKRELGGEPQSNVDFPRLYCEAHGLVIDLSMTVHTAEGTEEEDDVTQAFSREQLQDYNAKRNLGTVRTTVHELSRRLELLNRDVPMGYTQEAIRNAIAEYMLGQCQELAQSLIRDLTHDPELADDPDIEYAWEKLAFAVMEESKLTLDAQIAVMKGVIWQIKRKMTGREVTHHYMWILIGEQGAGKDTFMARFLAPLKSGARLHMSIEMALENRLIDIWRFSYAMVFPEMEKANNVDKDALKNMITAATMTRRPMRTNFDVVVGNNATFLGTANNHFSEMIKDNTGNRRFIPCDTPKVMDYDVVNETDYLKLWQSVNERDPENPAWPFWNEIEVLQEYHRVKSPTEEWCRRMQDDEDYRSQYTDWVKQSVLYGDFQKWEKKEVLQAKDRTVRRLFYEEMQDMCEGEWSLWEYNEDEKDPCFRINTDK